MGHPSQQGLSKFARIELVTPVTSVGMLANLELPPSVLTQQLQMIRQNSTLL